MKQVFTDKAKKMKKHEELWNKIRNSIRSITNNSDNYDDKYMKIRFNADSDLLFRTTSWRQQVLPTTFLRLMFA